MIVCPNCSHQNPEGAAQCEACYTPLPTLASCPSCGASVQSDASFCGQCGFDLRAMPPVASGSTLPSIANESANESASHDFEIEKTAPAEAAAITPENSSSADNLSVDIPDLTPPDPLVEPEPISFSVVPEAAMSGVPNEGSPDPVLQPPAAIAPEPPPVSTPAPEQALANAPAPAPAPAQPNQPTQIQVNAAKLLHIQTNTEIDLPLDLPIIHIGKPNDRIPPVIDVSGFPNSEIVSRVHASIRVEGDIYYIEDVGSSNGTYVNNLPLPFGNRHRLRPGDRVALGKGDKVSFLFQA